MTPYIKLIYLWVKLLEWFGNTFAALGMSLSGHASKVKDKVIMRLQIRREKLKRGKKATVYRLLVSHDYGMTYQCELEDGDLKKLLLRGEHLDTHMLRWYIMDEHGEHVEIACKIHGSIVAAVEDDMGQKIMTRIARKDMEKSE